MWLVFYAVLTNLLYAKSALDKDLQQKVKEDVDSFFDPNVDYSLFSGRATDRDETASVLKVYSENKNTRFFKSGDQVLFQVHRSGTPWCQGFVRKVDGDYFILFIKDIFSCWKEKFFRRGTRLNFKAEVLAKRVKEASSFRLLLMKKKRDYFKQLNEINHFIWNYDQKKIQVAAEYDKKILNIQRQKSFALDELLEKKKDQVNIQRELMFRLSNLDEDLKFYRVRNSETTFDRWQKDHDLGLPVGNVPQENKKL